MTGQVTGMSSRSSDQPGADTAVPRHVDKPTNSPPPPGAHPAQTVLLHPGAPVNVTTAITETLRMQGIDGRVLEIAAPVIGDR